MARVGTPRKKITGLQVNLLILCVVLFNFPSTVPKSIWGGGEETRHLIRQPFGTQGTKGRGPLGYTLRHPSPVLPRCRPQTVGTLGGERSLWDGDSSSSVHGKDTVISNSWTTSGWDPDLALRLCDCTQFSGVTNRSICYTGPGRP